MYDVDRVLREGYHQRNRAEARVVAFGRAAHNPRRRQAPLHDSYDVAANWFTIVGVIGGLICVAIGFGQTVLWLERLVRG